MANKYAVGDTVIVKRLNKRTPQYIRRAIRLNRKRRVVSVYYDKDQQHTIYHLGFNYRSGVDIRPYGFRAEQLMRPLKRESGRPRLKRLYRATKR